MTVLRVDTLKKLPGIDYRSIFFIYAWRELLYKTTPHFYQARFMNPISSLHEVYDILDVSLKDKRNISNLKTSCVELFSIIKKDTVIKRLLGEQHALLVKMLEPFNKNKEVNLSEPEIRNLKQIIKYTLNFEEFYVVEMIGELLKEVLGEHNEKHRETKLDNIYYLTSTFLSTLMSMGFSSTYLYNRIDMLTWKNRYGENNFSTQMELMLNRFNTSPVKYKVTYAFKGAIVKKTLFALNNVLGMNFFKKGEIEPILIKNKEYSFELDSIDGYITCDINSYDYISAAWKVSDMLNGVEDLVAFEYKRNMFDVSRDCVVKIDDGNNNVHPVRIKLLRSMLIKRSDPYPFDMIKAIDNVINVRDDKISEMLKRSLRYYKLGITSDSSESRFLSMWIALETIVGGEGPTIIGRIISTLPKLYAFDSLLKKLKYTSMLLLRDSIDVPSEISKELEGDTHEFNEVKVLYQILQSEKLTTILFKTLGDQELLKYRLRKLYLEFNCSDAISNRLLITESDVTQQLKRIYYYRNKVVHEGYHGNLSPRIYSHLCEYIGCVMSEIIVSLSDEDTGDIIDVLRGYSLALDSKLNAWEDRENLDFGDIVYLNPLL